MKIQNQLPLPESACAYERYDPESLEPLNEETYVRLQELGWSKADFAGRSVLDIGCNSGLLTVYALRLGAAKVEACDVQPALLEFVSSVVKAHKLPVTVSRAGFNDLVPARNKADIVLFMEVLHWAVSQGLQLRDVVTRLAALTGELLYIEFPWSVEEPSIQKQTKLTAETYSADAVLDELTRYFTDVRVVRFMRYFGFGSASKRVLIKASGKRPEAEILVQLPEVYSLDLGLSRGRNQSYLLTSAKGPLVAKKLAREGPLARISEELCNRMFDEIHRGQPKTVLLPMKCNGSYLLTTSEGARWMIFPFLGRLPSAGRNSATPTDFEGLVDLLVRVRHDLRGLPPDLIRSLRDERLFPNVQPVASPKAVWLTEPGELAEIASSLRDAVVALSSLASDIYDGLCHGDLQTGNFVRDTNNEIRVVDLDNLCVGPIYSDGIMGLMWRGAPLEALQDFCEKLRPEETRPVASYDVALALVNGIIWFSAVRSKSSDPVILGQIGRLRQGFESGLKLIASLNT
jgi:SAM-dependent methyltransferase